MKLFLQYTTDLHIKTEDFLTDTVMLRTRTYILTRLTKKVPDPDQSTSNSKKV